MPEGNGHPVGEVTPNRRWLRPAAIVAGVLAGGGIAATVEGGPVNPSDAQAARLAKKPIPLCLSGYLSPVPAEAAIGKKWGPVYYTEPDNTTSPKVWRGGTRTLMSRKISGPGIPDDTYQLPVSLRGGRPYVHLDATKGIARGRCQPVGSDPGISLDPPDVAVNRSGDKVVTDTNDDGDVSLFGGRIVVRFTCRRGLLNSGTILGGNVAFGAGVKNASFRAYVSAEGYAESLQGPGVDPNIMHPVDASLGTVSIPFTGVGYKNPGTNMRLDAEADTKTGRTDFHGWLSAEDVCDRNDGGGSSTPSDEDLGIPEETSRAVTLR